MCLIDPSNCLWYRWMMNAMNHGMIVLLWEYTCDCGCDLLNWSGVAFWHTILDRILHSNITMG